MAGESPGRAASPNPSKRRGGETLLRWVLVKSNRPGLYNTGMIKI